MPRTFIIICALLYLQALVITTAYHTNTMPLWPYHTNTMPLWPYATNTMPLWPYDTNTMPLWPSHRPWPSPPPPLKLRTWFCRCWRRVNIKLLDLGRAPYCYGLYGVKYISLVSLGTAWCVNIKICQRLFLNERLGLRKKSPGRSIVAR